MGDLKIEEGVMKTEDLWYNKITDTLRKTNKPREDMFFTRGPAQLTNFLFLGDYTDADSHGQLQDLGITHVLNCAGNGAHRDSRICNYGGNRHLRFYVQLDADDTSNYEILQHFPKTKEFIDSARRDGGKVLVHCAKGINRSAALCVAYLMDDEGGMDLQDAVLAVSRARGRVLTNDGFRRQLVRFAMATNRLRLS